MPPAGLKPQTGRMLILHPVEQKEGKNKCHNVLNTDVQLSTLYREHISCIMVIGPYYSCKYMVGEK